jgi:hypothetical protein
MVFYVTPGINADHMIAKDGRLCKVQGAPVKMERDMAPLGDNRNDVVYKGDKITFPILKSGKSNLSNFPFLGESRPKEGNTPNSPGADTKIPSSNNM